MSLFCNLRNEGDRLTHQPGSVVNCTMLVAGTTVGAGILALPSVTLPAGVLPSSVLLVGVWFYALASALLITEVNLRTMRSLGQASPGLLAMVEHTLGAAGGRVAGVAYLFLHYALLVAYMAQGGQIVYEAIAPLVGLPDSLCRLLGILAFTLIFGGLLYQGRQGVVEKLNTIFVGIVLISFFGLIGLGLQTIQPDYLSQQNWTAVSPAISIMLVTLFYHNIIPVVTTQLEGDVRKIRQAIVLGSLIPLVMFLLWNAVILGSVNSDLLQGTVVDPLQVLRRGSAGAILGTLISLFSEFAIATSFIGFVYGLVHFFEDLGSNGYHPGWQRFGLYSRVLMPPFGFAVLNPDIFFTALDYAGAFSISMLGGILPVAMAWKQRHQLLPAHPEPAHHLVPGGRFTLTILAIVAIGVIWQEIAPV